MENPEKPRQSEQPNGKKIMDEFVSWIEKARLAIKKDPSILVEMRRYFAYEKRRSKYLHRRGVLCTGAARDLIQEATVLNRRVGLMEIVLAALD